jgi:hypothetical protein
MSRRSRRSRRPIRPATLGALAVLAAAAMLAVMPAMSPARAFGPGPAADAPADARSDDERRAVSFRFARGDQGWRTQFADLPADTEGTDYELRSGWRRLPDGLPGGGVMLAGMNRSDDLWMSAYRRIGGLRPGACYRMAGSVRLATNAPTGVPGAGGSPGEGVTVKVGLLRARPGLVTDELGWLRVDFDKGNQSTSGRDAKRVGHLGDDRVVDDSYVRKTFPVRPRLGLRTHADDRGRVWVVVGTDSGFESRTVTYLDRVDLSLRPCR